MRVWTRQEVAEQMGVCPSLPAYWVKAWGPDSTHPFPQPVARVQLHHGAKGFGRRQDAYMPHEVRAWFAHLPAAKRDRRSKVMKAARARMVGVPMYEQRIAELEREVAGLRVMTRRASIAPLV